MNITRRAGFLGFLLAPLVALARPFLPVRTCAVTERMSYEVDEDGFWRETSIWHENVPVIDGKPAFEPKDGNWAIRTTNKSGVITSAWVAENGRWEVYDLPVFHRESARFVLTPE